MKIVVGLGNPGEKYENNRHNVGQMFVDYLINEFTLRDPSGQAGSRASELKEKKMLHVTCFMLQDLILAKPLTFMNLSGLAVKELIGNWKLEIGNLVVIHDDLDIPLGKFKIQFGTGPLLHNGIESIEQALGRKDFWRIRIGVDNRNPQNRIDGETYVLRDFLFEEKRQIFEIFPKILALCQSDMNLPGSRRLASTPEVDR